MRDTETQAFAITSYNCHGLGGGKMEYIASLCSKSDFVFLQEHWLLPDNLNIFQIRIPRISCHGTSAMSTSELLTGRPYGGCSILWKSNINGKITPVDTVHPRICAVAVEIPRSETRLLLINVYMPTDSRQNVDSLCEVLAEVSAIMERMSIDRVIFGGDMNTDFSRVHSAHSGRLAEFLCKETMSEPVNDIRFTFTSLSSGNRSFIDHFFLSENLKLAADNYSVILEGDNLSDHYPVRLSLFVPIVYTGQALDSGTRPVKLSWDTASPEAIAAYQSMLSELLQGLSVPSELLSCINPKCDLHSDAITRYCDGVISCLVEAGSRCVPKCKPPGKHVVGWNDLVRPLREDSIFWHNIWKECGSPKVGWVTQVMRLARVKYHRAVRSVKRNRETLISQKMAESLSSNSSRDFWGETRKINGAGKPSASNVDGATGDQSIATVFSTNYRQLYNSVSFSPDDMTRLEEKIENDILAKCCGGKCYSGHSITPVDISAALSHLKSGKNDGKLTTDHLIHGGHDLQDHLSALFTTMIRHGISPPSILVSTVVPIPKNTRKSLNDSSNYRGIALNSPINKLFELVVLCVHRDILSTSDLQFGYKRGLSTTACTFVAEEVIQYYLNSNNDVHVMLLDASKAFDCVHYVTLFNRLSEKGMCPLVIRVLLSMHLLQSIQVRWNGAVSGRFSVSNGVKQGGILSPVLFSIYTDILLNELSNCGSGCYMGNVFCGALAYADDIVLLAPNRSALERMTQVSSKCAESLRLKFNGAKSQYLVYRTKKGRTAEGQSAAKVIFCGSTVVESADGLHLGNLLGAGVNTKAIRNAVADLYRRTNVLMSRFHFCSPEVRYRLFKSFCVIAYGSPLWDLDDSVIEKFRVAWRKCIRRVWGLPQRTHCDLLSGICRDPDIHTQLIGRSVKFYSKSVQSQNLVLSTCAKFVVRGSGSKLSNSVTRASQITGCDRLTLSRTGWAGQPVVVRPMEGAVRDFVIARHTADTQEQRDMFSAFIEDICVN